MHFLLLTSSAVQGHTGDPVKDLEAKLKFIQEHVPTRISNVSGRQAHGSACKCFCTCSCASGRHSLRLTRAALRARAPEISTSIAWCVLPLLRCSHEGVCALGLKAECSPDARARSPQARRREQFRLERMDKEALEAEAQRTFEARQKAQAASAVLLTC